jgi:hypothetical protein
VNAIESVALPQGARTLAQEPPDEVLTMRGLWFGLLIAVPCWLILALLFVAVF